MIQPSEEEKRAREAALVEQAVAQARDQMMRLQPATPVESAAWMCRMMQEMWKPYIEPMVLKDSLGLYQVRRGRHSVISIAFQPNR